MPQAKIKGAWMAVMMGAALSTDMSSVTVRYHHALHAPPSTGRNAPTTPTATIGGKEP